jgi:hypothetical protein
MIGPLQAITGHTTNLLVYVQESFMLGYMEIISLSPKGARYLFGWIDSKSRSIKGIFISDDADFSGVFIGKKPSNLGAQERPVCFHSRTDLGEYHTTCLTDSNDDLGLYSFFSQDEMSEVTESSTPITYTLPIAWF